MEKLELRKFGNPSFQVLLFPIKKYENNMIYTVCIHFEENYENFKHTSIIHKEDDVRDTQGLLSRQKWLKHF